ncbi:hypothetical protein LCGC14_2079260 [marine sediment metagenome]|uniref:HNH nuclease domain-containing protein n=1 Tax=marine sediment metagenome TaxID=412755 RepID=A0A0F9GUG0_9ZZZZ
MTKREKAACSARWYYAHRDDILSKIRQRRRDNIDRVRAQEKARHDRRRCGGNWLKALERDNHTCQECGAAKGLVVHHIDGRGANNAVKCNQPINNSLSNLLTLCVSCHTSLHNSKNKEAHRAACARAARSMGFDALSARSKKAMATMGADGLSARTRKGWANLTPEQHALRVRKMREGRNKRAAERQTKER